MVVAKNIRLNKFKWTSFESVSVAGFTWFGNEYLNGTGLIHHIADRSATFEDFSKTIRLFNGQFSIVAEKKNEIWIAVSHTWSHALFYRNVNEEVYISDEPGDLFQDGLSPEFDPFSEVYFLMFGVAPLSNTLAKDVYQVQPGEIIRFRKQTREAISFLPFSDNLNVEYNMISEDELRDRLLNTFEKYFNVIKDKQVLLPLTRGYDSRLLACLLKEFGHNNVVCATWGISSGNEIRTANLVAEQLGYKHYFIDYEQIVDNDFVQTDDFKSFVSYAGHWSSMPFLYEYFGVKNLIDRKVIDESTIALPGHPGDFIRGDHSGWDVVGGDKDYLAKKIISKFGTTFPIEAKVRRTIQDYIILNFLNNKNNYLKSGYELWDFKERQCKFIGNSSQVFAYFGLEFLMPLFDLEIINFFRNLPDKQKIDQNLYNATLEKYFFRKFKVDFDFKPSGQTQKYSSIKEGMLKILPDSVKKLYYPMNDAIYYSTITQVLRNSQDFRFRHPLRPNAFNSYIIQWYLFSLQNTLTKNDYTNLKN